MKEFIIDTPHFVSPQKKITALGVTLFFWAMLLYLWQPLISLVAWVFNIKLFYNHMVVLGGYKSFLDLSLVYLITIAIMSGALLLWARVSQWRFRGKEKRKFASPVVNTELSELFEVDEKDLENWQSAKSMNIELDQFGEIKNVRTGDWFLHVEPVDPKKLSEEQAT